MSAAPVVEMVPVPLLRRYNFNARTHSDEQIGQIVASIREFGFMSPLLVDRDNLVISGHGRLSAAEVAGLAAVPCVRVEHLSEEQKRAYVIADNQIALNSGWDRDLLRLELADLRETGFDLGLTGFSDEELDALLKAEDYGEAEDEDEEPKFALRIESADEAEIMALRKIFGLKKKAGKVTAAAVLALLPAE